MFIPRFWFRASEGSRTCLGWSDANPAAAEKLARERLSNLLELGGDRTPPDWDYYPSTPLKEEILETPRIPEVSALITRNRSGAKVLNVDRLPFVDIDVRPRAGSLIASIGSLFRKRREEPNPEEAAALARAREWADQHAARFRAYRTAGGLRLIRMDALLDPDGEDCARMLAELEADPQYSRLCRIQRSFRARLTPKPYRVDCATAPGGHPRTDAQAVEAFGAWLESYEQACAGKSVCTFLDEYGAAAAIAPARIVVALHDRDTIRDAAQLA